MYRKIILSTLAILTLLSGCVPAQFEVGVEPTATPTEAAPVIEPTETPEIIEPTSEPTETPVEFGEVSGSVCFPSEFIPAMTIYFRDTSDGMLYALSNGENVSSFTTELPVGNYIAFGYPDNVDFGGMYSAAVPCGLNVDCLDHTPLPFDVLAGQTTTGIDICDWYAEPNQVPQNPNATFQVNPSLAGLVYQDLNAGGIWKVGADGTARPILDQWSAVISPDGSLALFEKDDDIYLADLVQGTWKNITNTADRWEKSPQFIPGDPMQVFFFSGGMDEERLSGQLTTANLDGFAYGALVAQPTSIDPAFSSDGTQMAYSLGDTAWIYDLSSGAETQFEPNAYGLSGVRFLASPSWSPDESRMAWWVVTGEGADSRTALAVFDLAAGTHRLIHSYQPIGGGGFNSAPEWSPDGTWMATIVLSENSRAALWAFSVDGEEILLGDMAHPVWSPNGNALLVNVWPQDGAAFDTTTAVFVVGEWSASPLDLRVGSVLMGFVE